MTVGSEFSGMATSPTGAEFVVGVGPGGFPPVTMIEGGGTSTGVMMVVLTIGGATVIGVRVEVAPPTIITCDDAVRTGGFTGVGSLVTGARVVPSSWPNRSIAGKR